MNIRKPFLFGAAPLAAFVTLLAGCGEASTAAENQSRHGAQLASAQRPDLDVPYVPTRYPVVVKMLELANVGPNDYVIDLGSGDGRILVAAARDRGARGFGVDIDPQRISEARTNAEAAGVQERVTFRRQDLFQTPINEATVLTMYLLPEVNMRLRPRILAELRPGTRVVSHAFHLGDWEPDVQEEVDGATVYYWVVPARVVGQWAMNDGGTLDLEQHFQTFSGTLRNGGRNMAIENGRIEGEKIRFTAGGRSYEAAVANGRMEARGWSAVQSEANR
jgi:SAM-dependent methyltransferase